MYRVLPLTFPLAGLQRKFGGDFRFAGFSLLNYQMPGFVDVAAARVTYETRGMRGGGKAQCGQSVRLAFSPCRLAESLC